MNQCTDFYPFYQKYTIFIKAGSKLIGEMATMLPMDDTNLEGIFQFEKLIEQMYEQIDLLESLVEIAGKKIEIMQKEGIKKETINNFRVQLEKMGSWILTKVGVINKYLHIN